VSSELLRELTELRSENARLKKLLRLTDHEAAPARGTQAAWFDRRPGPVDAQSPPDAKVAFYAALFRARRDVYAVRWENSRMGKSGWMPAVEGGWRKGTRPGEARHLPLTAEVLGAHLSGTHHVGLYPMLPGDQCCWLAADFDGPAAMLDALAYLKAARAVGAPAALEVSRSGVGAHVWLFFTDPVPAAAARQVGTSLIREAIALRGRMDLSCYDRLFPSQDTVPAGRFGNLIAAPLHGTSRKQNGTTVFLDLATLEPHDDQWDYLSTLDRLTPKQLARIASKLCQPPVGVAVGLHRPRSTRTQPRPAPVVHLTLDGGIELPADQLSPALYSTLKHAASLANPEFYDRQRRRQSTWNIPRFVQSYDETIDGRLILPRGLLDTAVRIVEEAGSKPEIDDRRVTGTHVDVSFTAELTTVQRAAVADILCHDLGLLVAPPGAGKTVMACAAIAQHASSTLVLVDRKTLADQWRTQIHFLLGVKPGQLGGGRSRLTGRIDIATLQTLAKRDDLEEKLAQYGLVVVDECHHIPAAAFEQAARKIPARRWLGLTATPYRRDRLDDLIAFQVGPVRHSVVTPEAGTIDAAAADRPEPRLYVHSTPFTYDATIDLSAPGAVSAVHGALADDDARNLQIIDDVTEALGRRRHCLVLAQRTAHVDHLAEGLAERGHQPVVLKGGMGVKARANAMARLRDAGHGPLLAVATGSLVGEGFDCPVLDTLFLAWPVSFKGRLIQYAGRVLRSYPGKTTAEVHDYYDVEVPVLAAALAKRAPGYVSLGFPDPRRGRAS
jgi:superfamily II DNA or RNA helicase